MWLPWDLPVALFLLGFGLIVTSDAWADIVHIALKDEEASHIPGATHPLILELPRTGNRSLYLASHASSIEGWELPEARLMLRELMEHATREANVYTHTWLPGDLVIWDNRATMHRARPFQDTAVRRELTRVTTLDIEGAAQAAA